jgi:hypothetical protein
MDHKKPGSDAAKGPKLDYIKQLLTNRMMLGFLRSIFYQHHYLVLPHLVPDLPGAGKGACRF